MKKIVLFLMILVIVTGCQKPQHKHEYLNNDYCSCGELNPEHVHEYVEYQCICGDKVEISKNKTEALNNAEYYFHSIDLGTVIDNMVVEYIDNDFVIFDTTNKRVSQSDLDNNTYSLFDYGVTLEIDTSNKDVLSTKWVKKVQRVYKYDELDSSKVIGIEYVETNQYIFDVNQDNNNNLIAVTFTLKAPFTDGDTGKIKYAVYQKVYNMVVPKYDSESMIELSVEKLLQYAVINKGEILNGSISNVIVTGVVTDQLFGDGYEAHSFVITDESGNSLYIYGPNDCVNIGDKVSVMGKPVILNGSVCINMFNSVKIISSGNKIVEPDKISIDDWYDDFPNSDTVHTISGKRIKIEGTLIKQETNGFIEYLIKSNYSDNYFKINNKSYTEYEQQLLEEYIGITCEFEVSVIYYKNNCWQVILNNYEYQPIKK